MRFIYLRNCLKENYEEDKSAHLAGLVCFLYAYACIKTKLDYLSFSVTVNQSNVGSLRKTNGLIWGKKLCQTAYSILW